MTRRTPRAARRFRVRSVVLAGCLLSALASPVALADTALGPSGADVGTATEPEFGAFDAVHVSAKLPEPTLVVDAAPQAEPGTTVPVRVQVGGTDATGEILVLQRFGLGGWIARSSTTVDEDGVARLSVRETDEATYRYRLRLSATTRHKAASRDFGLVVAPSPSPVPLPLPTPTATEPPTEPLPTEPTLCGGALHLRIDGSPWVCTYDDEFTGTDLDRTYWVPQVSAKDGFFSGSATRPACVIDDPRTIGVREGMLELSAVVLEEPMACGRKSSALVSGSVTHHGTFSQAYGRYEVRARVPSYQGKGLQETFWLWPNDPLKYGVEHPSSGEIDFGEFYSTYAHLNVPVMHYLFDPSTISYQTSSNIYTAHHCTIRVGEFNTYVLEWAPGRMRISINNQVCVYNSYTATNAPPSNPRAPFDVPFFLTLSQLFGTTGNEYDPATGPRGEKTEIDYVRIWS